MVTSRTYTLTGEVTPADKAADDYLLLPFGVPPGIGQLTVRYSYTHRASAASPAGSGNVVDIGVFDPRGAAPFQAYGFRGWSGSDRSEFTLGVVDATPGYLPGPIQPGTWHVILGLYRIVPEGCEYRVEIALSADPGQPDHSASLASTPGPAPRPLGQVRQWYRGDLQSHTHHSDGKGSVADLAAAARARGLDFVAVTDHNTVSHWVHLPAAGGDNLLLIPGQEITTYYGHANAWGARGWQEFRCRDSATMASIIAAAHQAGGLLSVNHPKEEGPPWEYSLDLPFDCIEVWQGLWEQGNDASVALWHGLLCQGRQVVAVGGSDKHQGPFTGDLGRYELGHPTTWVWAEELSVEGILGGIRAGHAFVSGDVGGPRLEFWCRAGGGATAMMGDVLRAPSGSELAFGGRVRGAGGQALRIVTQDHVEVVAIEAQDWVHDWRQIVHGDGFARLEVVGPSGISPDQPHVLVLSNPIYWQGTRSNVTTRGSDERMARSPAVGARIKEWGRRRTRG